MSRVTCDAAVTRVDRWLKNEQTVQMSNDRRILFARAQKDTTNSVEYVTLFLRQSQNKCSTVRIFHGAPHESCFSPATRTRRIRTNPRHSFLTIYDRANHDSTTQAGLYAYRDYVSGQEYFSWLHCRRAPSRALLWILCNKQHAACQREGQANVLIPLNWTTRQE